LLAVGAVNAMGAVVTVCTVLHVAFTNMTSMRAVDTVLVAVTMIMPVIVSTGGMVDIRGGMTHHMRAVYMLGTCLGTRRAGGAIVPAGDHKITARLPAH